MAERERATRASEKLKEESAQRVKFERELEDQRVFRSVSSALILTTVTTEYTVQCIVYYTTRKVVCALFIFPFRC